MNRRSRAVARALIERAPSIGVRFAVRPSDGTVERAGADLIDFPFQDAFTTEIPSLSQPHDLSTSTSRSCSAVGSALAARRSTAPTASGGARGRDDLLGRRDPSRATGCPQRR